MCIRLGYDDAADPMDPAMESHARMLASIDAADGIPEPVRGTVEPEWPVIPGFNDEPDARGWYRRAVAYHGQAWAANRRAERAELALHELREAIRGEADG